MVTAPPTPPPTTAAEIQDAASSASQVAPVEPVAPAEPAAAKEEKSTPVAAPVQLDLYQTSFPEISNFASQRNWPKLIRHAEHYERTAGKLRSLVLMTIPLVIAHLIEDELPEAHFALGRLPSGLQSFHMVHELGNLVTATTKRKYTMVYSGAESLRNQAAQPSAPEPALAALVVDMVTQFIDSFRSRSLHLLSKAYTSLPIALAQSYLGLGPEPLLAVVQNQGWTYESATQILIPKAPVVAAAAPGIAKGSFSGLSSLTSFDFVANSVGRLEM
ncbi:COP9 signalosome [Mycena floridula]|nr:COP9 signalosome [Mycena floridula]KAJ7578430.1 COP9 signalosome [Mycena floridula]